MNPLEYLYLFGYKLHKSYGLTRRKRLEGRTISVGNLTLGGTGKTPLTIEIAREAVKRGFTISILTRGYKSKSGESIIVSKGHGPLVDWEDSGDEPFLMALKTPGAWIVKDPNRYRGGLISGLKDLFLLDDGFQHWPLHRDIDVVLIDSSDPFGGGRLLPFGRLREPLQALSRASVIVITKAHERLESLEKKIRQYNQKAPIFYGEYRIDGFRAFSGVKSAGEITTKRGFIFSGIGNPAHFEALLREYGVLVVGSERFRDHHPYTERDLDRIVRLAKKANAEVLITTEKDMVRLYGFEEPELPLYAVSIRLDIKDRAFYEILFKDLVPREKQHPGTGGENG